MRAGRGLRVSLHTLLGRHRRHVTAPAREGAGSVDQAEGRLRRTAGPGSSRAAPLARAPPRPPRPRPRAGGLAPNSLNFRRVPERRPRGAQPCPGTPAAALSFLTLEDSEDSGEPRRS